MEMQLESQPFNFSGFGWGTDICHYPGLQYCLLVYYFTEGLVAHYSYFIPWSSTMWETYQLVIFISFKCIETKHDL